MVECFHGYAHHRCTVACMVTNSVSCIATNIGKASVGCMVTNSSKARFSIGLSQCDIKKAIESRVSLSLSLSLRLSVFGVSQPLDSE
jgi:hypothetical protein